MSEPANNPDESPRTPRERGEAHAAQIGQQEWVLDGEESFNSEGQFSEDGIPLAELVAEDSPPSEILLAEAVVESEVPPSPLQIIEAMLFIGGQPLTPEKAGEIVRGLGAEEFLQTIDVLNRVYRMQKRPYFVAISERGCTLTVRPRYRSIKEKIFGGPREARLTQPALDVLSLVAYRQPAAKAEIDSIRGGESGHLLRQLVRLGLISVVQRAEAKQREVNYGTTDRFLELFNLKSLEDLPQTGNIKRL